MLHLWPIVRFDRIESDEADAALQRWGHWLGGCNRPFGRQDFGLYLFDELVAVAVSASTVSARCGPYERHSVVELARLCADPAHRDLTRVAIRLWRKIAPVCWSANYWPVVACVSYANSTRHRGDVYRFDGWRKVADMPGSTGGGNWSRRKLGEPKSLWVFEIARPAAAVPEAIAR